MRTYYIRKEYIKLAFKVYGFKKKCSKCGQEKGRICVHHKDENFKNNQKENLEILCNACHLSYHKIGKINHPRKKVNQYTKNGEFIKTWDYLRQITKHTGFHVGNISSCCNGIRVTANGYIWKFKK